MSSAVQSQMGVAFGNEGFNCFVCDTVIVGRYYSLALCRTQTTKVPLIDKLGQLVGEQYMVVISEDDVICRNCTSLMNTLDRLEKELVSTRTVVLGYLERKCELEEGELVNSRTSLMPEKPKPKPQGPRKRHSSVTEFQVRKNKAVSTDGDSEGWSNSKAESKENMWLQCNKCNYTTYYDTFMTYHVRRHSKEKLGSEEISTNPTEKLDHDREVDTINDSISDHPSKQSTIAVMEENSTLNQCTTDSTTEDLMVADIGVLAADTLEEHSNESSAAIRQADEMEDLQISMPQVAAGRDVVAGGSHMTLSVGGDGMDAGTICMVDENGLIVQKVEQGEDGTVYVQVNADTNTKQMLSVSEDGSVQMVEVMWDEMGSTDEMVTPDIHDDHNIPF